MLKNLLLKQSYDTHIKTKAGDGEKCLTRKVFDNFAVRWVGFSRTTSVSDNFRVGQVMSAEMQDVVRH